jgi:hypothetical protein
MFTPVFRPRCRADKCSFQHSTYRWGENIAVGSGSAGPARLADMWYKSEVCKYNFFSSTYSEASGHFTQMVWAGTLSIGCAIAGPASCPGGVMNPATRSSMGSATMLICEYDPPGEQYWLCPRAALCGL